jgi:hypothetical protein
MLNIQHSIHNGVAMSKKIHYICTIARLINLTREFDSAKRIRAFYLSIILPIYKGNENKKQIKQLI